MPNTKPKPELPARDRLITRPDEPLPANPDPHCPQTHPTDPKLEPPRGGQGTDPKAADVGRVA
jgi:hypothetical protein